MQIANFPGVNIIRSRRLRNWSLRGIYTKLKGPVRDIVCIVDVVRRSRQTAMVPRTTAERPPRRKWLPAAEKRASPSFDKPPGSSVHVRIDVASRNSVRLSTLLTWRLAHGRRPIGGLPGITECSERNSELRKGAGENSTTHVVRTLKVPFFINTFSPSPDLLHVWRKMR